MPIHLEHISFAEWLVELNACALRAGYKCDQPFARITGILCWHSFYEEGYAPSEALTAAAQEGEKFGTDYIA